jgi:mono/diheme cytochrome c family protein
MLLVAACSGLDTGVPPVASLGTAAASADVARGRQLYVTSCAKCHSPEPVRRYSAADWQKRILPEMAELTKLTAAETAAVEAYVLAVLAESPPAGR